MFQHKQNEAVIYVPTSTYRNKCQIKTDMFNVDINLQKRRMDRAWTEWFNGICRMI